MARHLQRKSQVPTTAYKVVYTVGSLLFWLRLLPFASLCDSFILTLVFIKRAKHSPLSVPLLCCQCLEDFVQMSPNSLPTFSLNTFLSPHLPIISFLTTLFFFESDISVNQSISIFVCSSRIALPSMTFWADGDALYLCWWTSHIVAVKPQKWR